MAYQHGQDRHPEDPVDPYSPVGLRPHELPEVGASGRGAMIALVIVLVVAGAILLSVFAIDREEGAAQPPAGIEVVPDDVTVPRVPADQ